MRPEVRYGPWEPWDAPPEGPRLLARPDVRWRALTCIGCGATLLRQLTDAPVGPEEESWYPFPYETRLRQEISVPFGKNAQGWPIFGRARRALQGKRPRGVRRRYDEVELRSRELGIGWPVPPQADWPNAIRLMRRRAIGRRRWRLPPDPAHDFGPFDRSVWFSVDAPLPCEVRCHSCGRAHAVRGQGPEGAPPAGMPAPRSSLDGAALTAAAERSRLPD